MVSRMRTVYLKYDSQSEENELKLTSTPKLEFLPPITEIFLLNILRAHYLEQLPATQTSGNRPLSVKMSHYRIRVSLVVFLVFGYSHLFA